MHPYYPFVKLIFPDVLAKIVIDYASIIVRPFKKHHCVICGDFHHRRNTNICMKHRDTCPICFGYYPLGRIEHYCRTCEISHPWLESMILPYRNIWQTLYEKSDAPFNLPRLDHELIWIKDARQAWRENLTKIDKEIEALGEINSWNILNKVKTYKDARKLACDEFWATIPKFQTIMNRTN